MLSSFVLKFTEIGLIARKLWCRMWDSLKIVSCFLRKLYWFNVNTSFVCLYSSVNSIVVPIIVEGI